MWTCKGPSDVSSASTVLAGLAMSGVYSSRVGLLGQGSGCSQDLCGCGWSAHN